MRKESKNTNTVLNLIVITLIAIIIVSTVIGLYAWAKYTNSDNGSATAQVAKWNFKLTGGIKDSSGVIKFPITRTDEYDTVADDVLAPGTYGQFEIGIDATGTETLLEYVIDIELEDKPTNLKFYLEEGNKRELEVSKDNKLTVTGFMSLTDDKIRTETIYWNWPYTTEGENQEATAINDKTDTDEAGNTMTMQITATGIQVLEPTIQIGDYIDFGKSVVGTESTSDDWRIIYQKGDYVCAILAHYLPNDNEIVKSVGLDPDISNKYAVTSSKRETFINQMKSENWKNLLPANLQGDNEITVRGTIDLDTWRNSWNASGYAQLDIIGNENDGYGSNGHTVSVLSDTEGCKNSLYFLNDEYYAYWLASYPADSNPVSIIRVNGYSYEIDYFGVTVNGEGGLRPVVWLPSSMIKTKEGNVWSVK